MEEQYVPEPAPSVPDLWTQQSEVRCICETDVFQKNPGCATVVEHDIVLVPKNYGTVRFFIDFRSECCFKI